MVDVVLGLYSMVIARKDSTTKALFELVTTNYTKVFPASYFDDLPALLSDMMSSDAGGVKSFINARRNSVDLDTYLSEKSSKPLNGPADRNSRSGSLIKGLLSGGRGSPKNGSPKSTSPPLVPTPGAGRPPTSLSTTTVATTTTGSPRFSPVKV